MADNEYEKEIIQVMQQCWRDSVEELILFLYSD